MVNRREFLKASALGALGLTPAVKSLASRRQTSGYFTVHPFIENHPEAVFIMPTRIDNKMNSPAKREAGRRKQNTACSINTGENKPENDRRRHVPARGHPRHCLRSLFR